MKYYDFVIVTPGRSGSEHLSETIKNYPDLEMDGEVFNRSNFNPDSFNYFLRNSFRRKVVAYFFNREKLSQSKLNTPLKYLIMLFLNRENRKHSILRGFKLTLDQLNAYPFLFKYILEENLKIIYLHRQDKLSMALSHFRARKSGLYHSTKTLSEIDSFYFCTEKVINLICQIERWEKEYIGTLPPKIYLSISYEALWNDYKLALKNIRMFLGLNNSTEPVYSNLKKISPQKLEEWVLNLDEIKDAYSNLKKSFI